MVRTIATKEFKEMLRDGRFRWMAVVVLGLLVVSVAMGSGHYQSVQAQHDLARQESRDDWVGQGDKNPHSAAHYGTYAFKPKMTLSAVDPGVDPYVGVSAWLEAHRQNQYEFRPAQDATAVQRFGELTASTVLQLLVPLLIIVLAFSAFAGEREQGTLRQLMSVGVRPSQLATGKALGVAGALAVVLVPAAVLGVIAMTTATGATLLLADVPRLSMMVAAYCLYFAIFAALALAVSAKAPSSRVALIGLLGFWIFNGLLAPRAVSDIAASLYPSPSSFEFTTGIQNALANGIDGNSPLEERYAQFQREVLAEYEVDSMEELPVNYGGLRLQKSEEMGDMVFDHFYGGLHDTFEKQNHVRQMSSVVAPLLAVQSLSMGLAGTDFAQHRDFSEAAERYRRMLVKKMNDDLAYNSGDAGFGYVAGEALWESVPDFEYHAPSLTWVLGNHVVSGFVLLLWFSAAGLVAFRAASTLRAV